MNKFQLTVLIAALANLALQLFFPPFDSQSLWRMGPASFDAFYPAFDAPVTATLNSGLLYLEIFTALINAVLAWLLLQDAPEQPSRPRVRWQNVLQWLVIANLLLILLFPPFESRPDRVFEGFKFALSGSVQRGIFLPFLSWSCFCLRSTRQRCGWHLDSSLAGTRRAARNPPPCPNRLPRQAWRAVRTAGLGAAITTGGRVGIRTSAVRSGAGASSAANSSDVPGTIEAQVAVAASTPARPTKTRASENQPVRVHAPI